MQLITTPFEARCLRNGIPFSARDARLRCMPHTIHLAAIRLLEGIRALSTKQGDRATSRSGVYQESVNTPMSTDAENAAAALEEDEEEDEDVSTSIFCSVPRLRKIVRAVRSSPQR
ncbi:hypothetical protein HGRIS_014955 [Hohenbuehelia grisea]|uniref:Uncharacterized protein n=1 Tax=Hohenbuehelia grisea TaxID=104357 RepID=A0ABR3IZ34_9AGAR